MQSATPIMNKFYNILPVDSETCKILLYGMISSWTDDANAKNFAVEFAEAAVRYRNINIHINSTGGDVFEGVAIFNTLRNSQANVTIYIDGVAASIAGVIALCGKPVMMNKYSMLMLHRVSGGSYGDADKLAKAAKDMVQVEDMLVNMLADRMKLKTDEVKNKYFDGEDHWINADEALKAGLISGIFDGAKVDIPANIDVKQKSDVFYNSFNLILTKPNMKNLFKKLGLVNEADEDAAVQALEGIQATVEDEKLKVTNLAAENAALKAKLADFEKKEADAHTADIENLLKDAIAKGRIQTAQKDVYKSILEKDYANGVAAINALPVMKKLMNELGKPGDDPHKDFTFSDYQKKAPKVLAEMKANDPEGFKALYKKQFDVEPKI
jgi:ATP-dependent Clp endopeptidase proteolytic subunit ClpP